jgi:phage terminase large subunit GpA-like protein
MDFANFAGVAHDIAELAQPPARRLPTEVASKHLFSYERKQLWDATQTPYMIAPMNAIADRRYTEAVFVGPSRGGKSFGLVLGGIAYRVIDDPVGDITVIGMNQQESEDWSKTQLKRCIENSPSLAQRIRLNTQADTVHLKQFTSGLLLRCAHPSMPAFSSKTVRTMISTDADNFTGDMTIDEAFELASVRTRTFYSSGYNLAEGNPARDYDPRGWSPRSAHEAPPASGLLSLYNGGNRQRLYWPCPHCGEFFQAEPGYALFKLPDQKQLIESLRVRDPESMAAELCQIWCPHCTAAIEGENRMPMIQRGHWLEDGQTINAKGEVSGPSIDTHRASWWLGGVAAWSWRRILARYFGALKAMDQTGDEKSLKHCTNTDVAMPYVPKALVLSGQQISKEDRGEPMEQGVVPHGTRFITAQVDVQASSFEVQVNAHAEGFETWVVDRFSLMHRVDNNGNPVLDEFGKRIPLAPAARIEDWNRLTDKVITRTYPGEDGKAWPMSLVICDMGGKDGVHENANQYARTVRKTHRNFKLLKGANVSANSKMPLVVESYPDKGKSGASRGDVPVLMINTIAGKDFVVAAIARTEDGPGKIHLPSWLPDSYFKQLMAETRTAQGWSKNTARNEALDLSVYAYAAAKHLGLDKVTSWDKPPPWALQPTKSEAHVIPKRIAPSVPRREFYSRFSKR